MAEIQLYNGDCLEVMDKLKEEGVKVDAIITDPPYGTTACKWDIVIPFDKMWNCLRKIIKENGAIVLFGSEPFSSALRMSNVSMYRYDWIWKKGRPTNPLNCKKQAPRYTENISVFYKKQPTYHPQTIRRKEENKRKNKERKYVDKTKNISTDKYNERVLSGTNNFIYQSNIIEVSMQRGLHPTQKPVALMEYLVKTYTKENETVLDFTMGSGTTGVACKHLNRNFIGIELDRNYFEIAKKRIESEQGGLF